MVALVPDCYYIYYAALMCDADHGTEGPEFNGSGAPAAKISGTWTIGPLDNLSVD
jgi:hypothetical protein